MKSALPARIQSLALGFAALLLSSLPAQAWWKPEWTLRKKITVDLGPTGAAIGGPVGAAPVLIRLHDGDFPFTDAKPDGSDIRFVADDDRTPLPFHIEKYDSLLDEAFVWVRVPDLKPGAKATFWMYYGNTAANVARADDAKGTYDDDTALVYHFSEKGQPATDYSGHNLTAQNAGTPTEGAIIGGGLRLDEKNPVTVPAGVPLGWSAGGSMTWSAWVKFAGTQPNGAIFSRREGANAFEIGAANGIPYVEITTADGSRRSRASAPAAVSSWHHVAVVAQGQAITLYFDGDVLATLNAPLPALNGPSVIGAGVPSRSGGSADDGFAGELDELQISRAARSAGWIKFAALEQSGDAGAKVLSIGEAEQPRNLMSWLKGGYVGIIISSLSVDGWVVIGILAIMSVISWIVMIGKARFLTRVGAGNSHFLREWRHVASDLSVLDHSDPDHAKSLGGRVNAGAERVMRNAPLYRVYHVGVEEIRHRLASDRSNRALSARSIEAIRAVLDGTAVRESNRLSSQMVLLTIAISGGPFLGLLGTVVGVMITFAAVAAAGDVNVNAIAPGIAAALAATVAGLAVAIPSLFGYNYLLTRVKVATSEMHVFIDEFIAKMAEFYSDAGDGSRPPFQPQAKPTTAGTAVAK